MVWMSLSSKEINRLRRMTISELQVEVGREIYASITPRLSVEAEGGSIDEHSEALYDALHRFQVQPHITLNKAQAKQIFKSTFSKSKESLRHQICVRWDYCSNRAKYKNQTDLANAMVGMVPVAMEGLTVNGTYALVFLLIRMGLDKFCKCDRSRGRKRR